MLTWIMLASTAILIGIDQITKIWAASALANDRVISVIDGFFSLKPEILNKVQLKFGKC